MSEPSEPQDKPRPRPHRATQKTQAQVKTERLNAALRDNLRRRKASSAEAVVADDKPADSRNHEKATPSDT